MLSCEDWIIATKSFCFLNSADTLLQGGWIYCCHWVWITFLNLHWGAHFLVLLFCACVCVCVCVWKRERDGNMSWRERWNESRGRFSFCCVTLSKLRASLSLNILICKTGTMRKPTLPSSWDCMTPVLRSKMRWSWGPPFTPHPILLWTCGLGHLLTHVRIHAHLPAAWAYSCLFISPRLSFPIGKGCKMGIFVPTCQVKGEAWIKHAWCFCSLPPTLISSSNFSLQAFKRFFGLAFANGAFQLAFLLEDKPGFTPASWRVESLKLASLQHASMFLVPRTQSQALGRNSVNEWMNEWVNGNPIHKPCLVFHRTQPCLPHVAFWSPRTQAPTRNWE